MNSSRDAFGHRQATKVLTMKSACTFFLVALCAGCGSSAGVVSVGPDQTYALQGYFERFDLTDGAPLHWTVGSCHWDMTPFPQYGEFHPGESGIVINHSQKKTEMGNDASARFYGTFAMTWNSDCDIRGHGYAYLDITLPLHSEGEDIVGEGDGTLSADFPDNTSSSTNIHVKFTVDGAKLALSAGPTATAPNHFWASINYTGPNLAPTDRPEDVISFDKR